MKYIVLFIALVISACVQNNSIDTQKKLSSSNSLTNRLKIDFSGDCWVLLKNETDNILLKTGIQKKNSTLLFELSPEKEYKIILGDPSSSQIWLNSEKINYSGERLILTIVKDVEVKFIQSE